MMEGWNKELLGDLLEINIESIGRNYPFKKINYYDISSVKSGFVEKIDTITLNSAPSRAKRIVKNKDTILSTVRPRNRSFYYFKEAKENDIVSTGFAVLRPNLKKLDDRFLYHLVTDFNFTAFLASNEKGAAYPAVTPEVIGRAKINLPPLPTQRKIAKILSAYDDLIENNLKRIKLLEEMAQNEFNNWYANNVDFDKVNLGLIIGHEIGGGWGAEELSEEFSQPAYVIRGTDIDELPNGKLEKVPFRFHKKSNLASRKLQDGDIIFEVSGGSSYEGVAKTLLVTDELLKQFDNAVMPASFCKLARPIERKYSNLLFLFWRFLRNIKGTEVFEIRSASNIVNYNWTAFLKFQKIKKPSNKELEQFNKKIEPIYKQVYNLGNQNQRLKEARDILLPRLMTGMIDVEGINLYSNNEKELLNLAAEPKGKYGTN